MARELFVSTETVKNWLRLKQIAADVAIPFGRSSVVFFKPERVEEIRSLKKLKKHGEETIVEDFREFIEQGTYTFSYKMYFMLALLETVDCAGDAEVEKVLDRYISAYEDRFNDNLVIDRDGSPYNSRDYVSDREAMKISMLENPFEKFERKRFLYHARDLAKISIHHKIWDDLQVNDGIRKLREKMKKDLDVYYSNLSGIKQSKQGDIVDE
jgi:hypothetical protein